MHFLELFYEFFKIGLFSVGGGLATLPFLFDIADRYPWFDQTMLLDMVAVGESTPGPIGVNVATYAGYTSAGILGGCIATFGLVKDMNQRGKVVNIAFAVSAAFVFGDHLGFTAGFAPEMIGPMIIGKLVGGISAVAVAMWLTKKD